MNQIDILLTLAQVSVAIAGFASLASVVGQVYTTTDPQVNAIRLRGLLNVSLATLFLSLFAALLLDVPILGSWCWRAPALIGLVCAFFIGWGVIERDLPRRRLAGYNKLVGAVNFVILFLVAAGFAITVSGIAGPWGLPLFVATLILMLLGASTVFILVVISLLAAGKKAAT